MKAFMGDEIVCDCPPPAGRFRRDVLDDAAISGGDFAIDLSLSSIEAGRYVCKMCKATVAELSGAHWRVRTRNGWTSGFTGIDRAAE
jgi:hypothetical protein